MGEGEPLTGDGVTAGIVRIGDTVRRAATALEELAEFARTLPPSG